MRKLLITTAAVAGLFVSTTTVGASGPTATYSSPSHGHYTLCVTNNVGYPYNIAQIQVTGLAKKPAGSAPANWSFSSIQVGTSWTAQWTALDPSVGVAPNTTSCAFTFTQAGRPLKKTLNGTVLLYDNAGFPISVAMTAARV